MAEEKAFAWSFSAWQSFETCPWRYYLVKTKQAFETQNEASLEGNRKHKAFERALKGSEGLPADLVKYQPIISYLLAIPGFLEAERKVCLNPSFEEVGYFAKDAWFRVAFDVRVATPKVTYLFDWKDGKRKDDSGQLELAAATEFTTNPACEVVESAYIWLKEKKLDKQVFKKAAEPMIWQKWTQRAAGMEKAWATNNFPKRPSGLCKEYCPVGKSKCEHCGKP